MKTLELKEMDNTKGGVMPGCQKAVINWWAAALIGAAVGGPAGFAAGYLGGAVNVILEC